MPIKKAAEPLSGPSIVVDDVFKAAELARLAEDWSRDPHLFAEAQLSRYQKLCNYFDVDGTELLFQTQSRDSVQVEMTEMTGIMPAVGDKLPVFDDIQKLKN